MLEKEIKNNIQEVSNFPKAGVAYKDISPILANSTLCTKIIEEFCKKITTQIEVVCGIESRGFLFGMGIAQKLQVPFVMVRKQGKLPGKTIDQSYELEYGKATIEISENAIEEGSNVLIHDDVLATGGTAKALAILLSNIGVNTIEFNFLIEISELKGRDLLLPFSKKIVSLADY